MKQLNFSDFLFSINQKPLRVLNDDIRKAEYVALDLSEDNEELQKINISSSPELGNYVNDYIEKHAAKVAFGGYNEIRSIYKRSSYFNLNSDTERNIHIGMDLWCDAESPIYAPLDATVHSFKNNMNYGDYGPTIILKHHIDTIEFYTLYGHLSLASIENLKADQVFKQGEQIATLGDASVNGDYPPHLHFQIIKDLQGFHGDYPGVCNRRDLAFYLNNCPDPNLFLKLGI